MGYKNVRIGVVSVFLDDVISSKVQNKMKLNLETVMSWIVSLPSSTPQNIHMLKSQQLAL
jgi:hypothetical protein